jgi:hypothetical protein
MSNFKYYLESFLLENDFYASEKAKIANEEENSNNGG